MDRRRRRSNHHKTRRERWRPWRRKRRGAGAHRPPSCPSFFRWVQIHVVLALLLRKLPLLPQGHLLEHELPRFIPRLEGSITLKVPCQIRRQHLLQHRPPGEV